MAKQQHNLVVNVYPGGKPNKAKQPNYHRLGIEAARRMGYVVGDDVYKLTRDEAEATYNVPHGRQESGSGPAGQNGNPDTTSLGGGVTPGMKVDLVASFPLQGARFIYVPTTDPDGNWTIFRRDMQQSSSVMPEQVGGPYEAGDGFLWSDTTSTEFRIWRTERQMTANDDMSRAGAARAGDGALGISSRTWEQGGANPDRGEGEELSGVGAESWVGGRKNVTGYVINTDSKRRVKARRTGDAQDRPLEALQDALTARLMAGGSKQTGDARPGITHGRNTAKLVSRRVSALQQMNAANKAFWS